MSKEEIINRRKYLRQHMMENGLQGMPIVDIVELILYYTIPGKDVRPIAQELVDRFGTIDRMAMASSAERRSIPGIGERTDEHFAMIGMFVPQLMRSRLGRLPVLDTLSKLKEFCVAIQFTHQYEVLYVLCLNAGFRLVKKEVEITRGTPTYVNVELKHIMDALAYTATSKVVLCHNHPSGLLKPSGNDVEFTHMVKSYLDRINVTLHDHIIVADNRAISLRALKLIK